MDVGICLFKKNKASKTRHWLFAVTQDVLFDQSRFSLSYQVKFACASFLLIGAGEKLLCLFGQGKLASTLLEWGSALCGFRLLFPHVSPMADITNR